MLVTSRTTKRWIIPKGWPLDGKPLHATAAQEAREEAGLVGKIAEQPIGSYSYMKRLKSGEAIECEVHVFRWKSLAKSVVGQKNGSEMCSGSRQGRRPRQLTTLTWAT